MLTFSISRDQDSPTGSERKVVGIDPQRTPAR
jgi:hypothetical protein